MLIFNRSNNAFGLFSSEINFPNSGLIEFFQINNIYNRDIHAEIATRIGRNLANITLGFDVTFFKIGTNITQTSYFFATPFIALARLGNIPNQISDAINELDETIEGIDGDSGLIILSIDSMKINFSISGGCYTVDVESRKGVIIPTNTDDRCLIYCIGLYFEKKNNPNNFKSLSQFPVASPNSIDISKVLIPDNFPFPVQFRDLGKIERLNGIKICVWMVCDSILPKKRLRNGKVKEFDLKLVYSNSKKTLFDDNVVNLYFDYNHFSFIHDLNLTTGKDHFICHTCNRQFTQKRDYKIHEDSNCTKANSIKLPKEGEVLSFENFKKKDPSQFVVFADFESLLVKRNDKVGASSNIIAQHVPIAIGFLLVNLVTGESTYYKKIDEDKNNLFK